MGRGKTSMRYQFMIVIKQGEWRVLLEKHGRVRVDKLRLEL